jgi:hypothetical protein
MDRSCEISDGATMASQHRGRGSTVKELQKGWRRNIPNKIIANQGGSKG